LIPPLPDWILVTLVDVVEPMVTVLTAPPVAILTVVAAESFENPMVPVPEFTVRDPLAEVTLRAPEPDCTVVDDDELVLPSVLAWALPVVPTVIPDVPQSTVITPLLVLPIDIVPVFDVPPIAVLATPLVFIVTGPITTPSLNAIISPYYVVIP
jgi:hypothetical protein